MQIHFPTRSGLPFARVTNSIRTYTLSLSFPLSFPPSSRGVLYKVCRSLLSCFDHSLCFFSPRSHSYDHPGHLLARRWLDFGEFYPSLFSSCFGRRCLPRRVRHIWSPLHMIRYHHMWWCRSVQSYLATRGNATPLFQKASYPPTPHLPLRKMPRIRGRTLICFMICYVPLVSCRTSITQFG